jgi:TonB family protein
MRYGLIQKGAKTPLSTCHFARQISGREGALTRLEITRSSGHEVLDREAERAVQSAAPFPSTITVSRLNINVSFDYTLSKKK